MSAEESRMREDLCRLGRSMFSRGLTHGSTGNLSVRLPDGGYLMTPTGSKLGELDPARLSKLDAKGSHLDGDKPTKESFLHIAMYEERARSAAVVHLHSTYSTAVSVLEDVDPEDVLPPLTAYYVMRIGTLPLVPYFAPGSARSSVSRAPVPRRRISGWCGSRSRSAFVSATQTGLSEPLRSIVTSVVICTPPSGSSSKAFRRMRARSSLPTGTGEVKRTRFNP